MKGRKIKFRIFYAALLFGSLIFVLHFMLSEAASEEGFSNIEKGMTKVQVMKLLGTPHHGHTADLKESVFAYGGFKRLKWCTMEVFFDDYGRVSAKFHDH